MDLKGKIVLRFYCENCQSGIKFIPKLLAKEYQSEKKCFTTIFENLNDTLEVTNIVRDITENKKLKS